MTAKEYRDIDGRIRTMKHAVNKLHTALIMRAAEPVADHACCAVVALAHQFTALQLDMKKHLSAEDRAALEADERTSSQLGRGAFGAKWTGD